MRLRNARGEGTEAEAGIDATQGERNRGSVVACEISSAEPDSGVSCAKAAAVQSVRTRSESRPFARTRPPPRIRVRGVYPAVNAFRESLNSDSVFRAVTVTVTVRVSAAGARPLAARILVLAGVGVCALFLVAWTREDEASAHLFDCLHWTLAYLAAAVIAWLGVRDATGVDRVARRWFAIGLT